MLGADMVVANLLRLNSGVKRMMFCMQGCADGASLLSVAKSVAESSPASSLLVLCGDVGTVATFRGPESSLDTSTLIGQSFVADGMATLIVGANPSAGEVPLFHIRDSLSYLLPHTEALAHGHLSEAGVTLCVSRDFPLAVATAVPELLSASPELKRYLRLPTGDDRPPTAFTSNEFNSYFWAIHAAGRKTLDLLQEKLGLTPDKMNSNRETLAENGNMGAATALFALERLPTEDLRWSLWWVMATGLLSRSPFLRPPKEEIRTKLAYGEQAHTGLVHRHDKTFEAVRDTFKRFDKNGNGTLELEQLKDCFRQLQVSFTDEEVKDLYAKSDMNANSGIDFKEFIKPLVKLCQAPKMRTRLASKTFEEMDWDKNGLITFKEFLFAFTN
ncbi:hypothetical protein L7F22_062860 [Adiantum nelumboides]|nr:hypothetical protein [Adiantum nelumboides]